MIFHLPGNSSSSWTLKALALQRATAICLALIALAGCAVNSETQMPTEKTAQDRMRMAATAELNQGIELYNRGDYQSAIKQLGAANGIWKGDKGLQLEALKYMAFSYCVTGRPIPCRQEFEKALKLDPHFDLAPGEKGHPLWGPVFDRLKKSK